jgi:DNA-binding NtrC family response regulator
MTDKGKLLVVDDDLPMCEMLQRGLSRAGFEVETTTRPEVALAKLASDDFDALLTDLSMAGMTGLQLCERALAIQPGLPVVVITAFGTLETAIGAIRAGAYDFLTKPFDVEVAALALQRAVQYRRLRGDLKRLREAAERSRQFGELLGDSPVMQQLQDLLERVRDSDVTVLITGESGTGKELVARTLHRTGRRSDGPFVAINCAALPETLLESELFGHVRGAFTDAKTARTGLFLEAEGGTLFLDEIGELPASIQAKLLRALQDRSVRPVGGSREVPFDARIVAATNRDLLSEVEEGRFRDDLYFRLNVLEVPVPPLRARGRDVLVLAERFVRSSSAAGQKAIRGLSVEAAQRLCDYHWPGNVRELQNCIERAVALARYDQITVDDLPDRIRNYERSHVLVAAQDPSQLVSLEVMERRYILEVLEAVGGQRGAAAKILGLDRKTLYRKLERWGQGRAEGDAAD